MYYVYGHLDWCTSACKENQLIYQVFLINVKRAIYQVVFAELAYHIDLDRVINVQWVKLIDL